jgi:hypothetical protein
MFTEKKFICLISSVCLANIPHEDLSKDQNAKVMNIDFKFCLIAKHIHHKKLTVMIPFLRIVDNPLVVTRECMRETVRILYPKLTKAEAEVLAHSWLSKGAEEVKRIE